MMRRRIACALLCCCAPVLASIGEPRAGWVRAADGTVRALAGVAGSFVSAERIVDGGLSCAYSGRFGAIKLDHSIRLSDGTEFDAPAGGAAWGFAADGLTAYAWFPANGSFARIAASGLEWVPVDAGTVAGDVIAVSGLTLFVRRVDGVHAVRVRAPDGAVESDVALGVDAKVAVALRDGTLVYAADGVLIVRDSTGSERSLEVTGNVQALALMGDGWIQVFSDEGERRALRVTPDGPRLYEFPEAPE